VEEESSEEARGYQSILRVAGVVAGRPVSVAGTIGRGPLIAGILGFALELPLASHLIVIRNQDIPGMIGRVGTLLGELDINISDMVLGRSSGQPGMALMVLSVARSVTDDELGRLSALRGVGEAVAVELDVR